MGIFIEVRVTSEAAEDPAVVKKLAEVCPVTIFSQGRDGKLKILDENLDECTLCELCLDAGPAGSVQVLKLYDEGRPLERSA